MDRPAAGRGRIAALVRWQAKPSSQGRASQTPALQRKPSPQVPLHGGRHSEPTPSALHESGTAQHTVPLAQSLDAAQRSCGGTPQA